MIRYLDGAKPMRRTAKNDREEIVRNNLLLVRIYVDRESDACIGKIAGAQHRTKQRQIGIMLERIARMAKDNPQKLAELGLINPQTPFTPAPPAQ